MKLNRLLTVAIVATFLLIAVAFLTNFVHNGVGWSILASLARKFVARLTNFVYNGVGWSIL